jgi:hypothetical protein
MSLVGLIGPVGRLLASLAVAGALSAFAQAPSWGASPFGLTVETAEAKPAHIDVRVALAVPPRHVVYAESFRVQADPGIRVERVSGPDPDSKPDLIDPSKTVQVYAHPFESVWRLTPSRPSVRLTVSLQG